jgi:competence ComEA-like helix-hairpin-helix protein
MLVAAGLLLAAATSMWIARPHTRAALPPVDAAYLIDLNAADAAELSLLPGIGPTLGQRIVDHRRRHGSFSSVDDVVQVPGIGPVRRDDMRPHVRIGPAANGALDGAADGEVSKRLPRVDRPGHSLRQHDD